MSGDEEFVRSLRERADAAAPRIDVDTAVVVPRARRRRAATRAVGALAVAAVVVGGTVGAAALLPGRATNLPGQPPTGAASAPVTAEQRLGLIDMWRVDAAGEGPDTWLRLSGSGATLFRECGQVQLSWAVGPTTLVASVASFDDACAEGSGPPAAPWLDRASLYRAHGDGWELLDESGAVLATLRHDGLPTRGAGLPAGDVQAPTKDDAQRLWVGDPAPLPAGLVAASRADLLGRWVSPGSPVPNDPYVELAPDGTWTGSDGCNVSGARWATDVDGRFLVTSGASTLVGCDGAPLPDLLVTARRAALDGATLVLLDQDGVEVMRLAREGEAVTPPAGGTPAAGSEEVVLECRAGSSFITASTVEASSAGVRFVVQNVDAPAGTSIEFRWEDTLWNPGELPSTDEAWLVPAPPGRMSVQCVNPGVPEGTSPWPQVFVDVTDPNGYWRPTTPIDLGCEPGGVLDMAIPPEATGRATAREAVEGLAAGSGTSGLLTVAPVPNGYVDAETPTWLVYRDGAPYLGVEVTAAGGTYSASGGVMCRSAG